MIRLVATMMVGVLLSILSAFFVLPMLNGYILPIANTLPNSGAYLQFKNLINFLINNWHILSLIIVAGGILIYYSVKEGMI